MWKNLTEKGLDYIEIEIHIWKNWAHSFFLSEFIINSTILKNSTRNHVHNTRAWLSSEQDLHNNKYILKCKRNVRIILRHLLGSQEREGKGYVCEKA